MRFRFSTTGVLFLSALIVATPTSYGQKAGKKGEDEIRQAFVALQKAIKAKDGDKIYDLLAKESQIDADREAKALKDAYAKADEKGKAEFQTKFDLTAKELADPTGKHYVKSKRFYGKYHEIPDSKIEKITVSGDMGTVRYVEEDGDKIKQEVVREQGKWKFVMKIPKSVE